MQVSQNTPNLREADFRNKIGRVLIFFTVMTFLALGPHKAAAQQSDMMIRIAEIEIHAENIAAYKAILKEEAAASVKLEAGVVAIFPMYQKENPAQIRILEIYRDKAAYEQHLKTPHFQKYKTTTLKMVKSLKLTEMEAIDPETMHLMFGKLDGK